MENTLTLRTFIRNTLILCNCILYIDLVVVELYHSCILICLVIYDTLFFFLLFLQLIDNDTHIQRVDPLPEPHNVDDRTVYVVYIDLYYYIRDISEVETETE